MADNHKYALLIIKALGIWVALSLAGFFWGEKLIDNLVPFYESVAEAASEGYVAKISVKHEVVDYILLEVITLHDRLVTPKVTLPAGTTLPPAKITVLHALVPIVILLTIVFAWPIKNSKQRLYLYLMAVPALFFVSALTTPLQLLGNLELGFQNAAASVGLVREPPLVLTWMLLTEGGGRWLLPVLAAVACGGISAKLGKTS